MCKIKDKKNEGEFKRIKIVSMIFIFIFGILPLFSVLSLQNEENRTLLLKELPSNIQVYNPEKLINTISLFTALISILFIIAGIGLFKRKEIVRKSVVLFMFSFLCVFLLLSIIEPGMLKNYVFYILGFGSIIYYLTDHRIKRFFY